MACEEKQESMETVQEEILKRSAIIEEHVVSLKDYIKENSSEINAYDSCFVIDMEKLKEMFILEKEMVLKKIEESRKQQQKLKESYNNFLIEQ